MEKKEQKTQEIAKRKNEITEQVLEKIRFFQANGDLKTHKDYHPENALKSAYLILAETLDAQKKPVLESCSKESIANALLEMVTQGLNPMRNQCYFIPYAGKLDLIRSYLGSIAILKRDAGAKSVISQAIYEKDDFAFSVDFKTGIKRVTKHEMSLDSMSSKVVGAYCIITFNDDSVYTEIMNIDQIKAAWAQRKGNPISPAHEKFSDEMAKKTVINRACKPFINTISDSNIYDESDEPVKDIAKENLEHERQSTEKKTIVFEDAEIVEETKAETEMSIQKDAFHGEPENKEKKIKDPF